MSEINANANANARASALSAETPLIRSESAFDAHGDDDRVHLLTALRPEQGWPRLWAFLPVRLKGEGPDWPLEPIGAHGEGLRLLPFDRGNLDIGEPLRQPLPLGWFPTPTAADDRCGLLLLFIYAHPQVLSLEGGNEALLSEPDLAAVADVIAARIAIDGPELLHGFIARPGAERADGVFSFALAACQYPPGVLDHSPEALDHPESTSPAEASLARLVAFCRRHPLGRDVSLLLIGGDQIYADASSGMFDANNQIERYAQPYMAFKASVIRHLPPTVGRIVHAPDDHEIEDNWEPVAGARDTNGPLYAGGRRAAWTHRWDPRPGPVEPEKFWHSFDWRGAAFFIGDSRTERGARRIDIWRDAEMISRAQRDALSAWLGATASRPQFLLTSALVLPRRLATREHAASALRSDAWDGYPASLHWLLGEAWRQRADGLVCMSGDEHRSGFVSARIEPADGEGAAVTLHSIHSSGLYTPWPFAVTAIEDFAAPESFEFPGPEGQVLRCTVTAWTDFPGDGFAVLRHAGRRLEVWFDKAKRPLYASDAGLPPPDGSFDT